MNRKSIFKLLAAEFFEDDIPSLAAQLTFYLTTAFFPFLILLFSIVTYTPLLSEDVLFGLLGVLPKQTFDVLFDTLKGVTRSETIMISAGIIALWSMSGAMSTIAKAINKFYDTVEDRNFFILRVWGIFFSLLIIIAIAANFILLVLGTLISRYISLHSQVYTSLWNVLRICIPPLVMAILFAVFYKVMPNRRVSFKSVLPGACFTAVVWTAASQVFAYYVNNFANYHIIYGSIGGIIALLTWIYMTAYIILIGADINALIAGYRKLLKRGG